MVKSVSVDGGTTWQDADTPPGPSALIGHPVMWRYVITNTGNVTLTGLALVDDVLGPITLGLTTLAPLGSVTAFQSGIAVPGQYTNVATVVGTTSAGHIEEITDPANYYGRESLGGLFQAHAGNSGGLNRCFLGYRGLGEDVITAVPGVFSICPGDTAWSNYVAAAQDGVDYTVKNVTLRKVTPEIVQCGDVFVPGTVTQQGTPQIRLWWPLMYEIPGTKWTLSILYGTPVLYDDDGDGPRAPGFAHNEVWEWTVGADIQALERLVDLFHELPFGTDEVPLISDEALYQALQDRLSEIQGLLDAGDTANAGLALGDLELLVVDACIGDSPEHPNPTGPGTGIANSEENPACCKILADIEFIAKEMGIFFPVR